MTLPAEQAQAVYAALKATRGHVTHWYGELSPELKVSVSRSGAISVNMPGLAERWPTMADFMHAHGITPTLAPLVCPIEAALSDAHGTISRMQQRQPSVVYSFGTLWDKFEAARAEARRLKGSQ